MIIDIVLMADLDETLKEASYGCSLPSDTISRLMRNVHILLDSRKRLRGQVDSPNIIYNAV